jgi:hypothetical protein
MASQTANTIGLTAELRNAIGNLITADNLVPCIGEVSRLKREMVANFGSPKASGYMSEGSGWQLDADDAAAIRE